jgi:hypothetical protein
MKLAVLMLCAAPLFAAARQTIAFDLDWRFYKGDLRRRAGVR